MGIIDRMKEMLGAGKTPKPSAGTGDELARRIAADVDAFVARLEEHNAAAPPELRLTAMEIEAARKSEVMYAAAKALNEANGNTGPSPLRDIPGVITVSALEMAVQMNRIADIKVRLARGDDPNAANESGWYPLHVAAEAGHSEAARLLLLGGADPLVKAPNGMTPSDVAYEAEHGELGDLLAR